MRTVTFGVDDGTDPSNSGTRTVGVTPVNDPPDVALAGTPVTYTEGDASTPVDPTLTVTDLDDPTLTRAQVHVLGFHADEEWVHAIGDGSISVTYDQATGTLDFAGVASAVDLRDGVAHRRVPQRQRRPDGGHPHGGVPGRRRHRLRADHLA